MIIRHASCSCGQLSVDARGEPQRVSLCHCHACQKRTGSAFGYQLRFASNQATISGESREFARTGDSGGTARFHFCPHCGATVYWQPDGMPEAVYVAAGTFADSSLPPPSVSVYDETRHRWLRLPEDIAHE